MWLKALSIIIQQYLACQKQCNKQRDIKQYILVPQNHQNPRAERKITLLQSIYSKMQCKKFMWNYNCRIVATHLKYELKELLLFLCHNYIIIIYSEILLTSSKPNIGFWDLKTWYKCPVRIYTTKVYGIMLRKSNAP